MTRVLAAIAFAAFALAAPAQERASGGQGQERPTFRMPPQEAIAACASLALDATCAFTFDGRAHQGTCRRGPEGQGPIACAPNRGPKPGQDRGAAQQKSEPSAQPESQPQR